MKRSNAPVVWLSVALILGVMGFRGYMAYQKEVKKNKQILDEFQKTTKKFKEDNIRLLKEDKGGKLGPDYARRINILRKTARKLPGDSKTILLTFANVLQKQYDIALHYDKAAADFEKLGGVDLGTVKELKNLKARSKVAKDWLKHTTKLRQLALAYTKEVITALKKAGMGKAIQDRVKVSLGRRKAQFTIQHNIRKADQELIRVMSVILEWAVTKWGTWKLDPKDKLLVFSGKADQAKYNQWVGQIDVLIKQQKGYQKQLIKILQGR